jgi:hypothetical protein
MFPKDGFDSGLIYHSSLLARAAFRGQLVYFMGILRHYYPQNNVKQNDVAWYRDKNGKDKKNAYQHYVYLKIIGQTGGYTTNNSFVHVAE